MATLGASSPKRTHVFGSASDPALIWRVRLWSSVVGPTNRRNRKPESFPRSRHPKKPCFAASQRTIETPQTATDLAPHSDKFVWQRCWYPLTAVDYLDPSTPLSITVLGYDLVVWRDSEGEWQCFRDACPHRAAPLSEGAINPRTGHLQCAYHGWEFNGSGTCTAIPQSEGGDALRTATRSPRSCATAFPTAVAHGLLWAWLQPGDAGKKAAAESPLPVIPSTSPTGVEWFKVAPWYVRDMEVDYVTLMENSADPSHVHFTHAGFIGAPDRAGPITVKLVDSNNGLFEFLCEDPKEATFRHLTLSPPCMLWASSEGMKGGDLALLYFVVPVAPGRSRLMSLPLSTSPAFRLPARIFHYAPWIRHLFNHTVAAQDAAILHRQGTNMASADFPGWRKGFYLPTPADSGMTVLRKWLESTEGEGIGWGPNVFRPAEGASAPRQAIRERNGLFDNYRDHTRHCPSCTKALKKVQLAVSVAKGLAAVCFLSLAVVLGHGAPVVSLPAMASVLGVAAMLGLAAGLRKLEKSFFQTEWRHAENKKLLGLKTN